MVKKGLDMMDIKLPSYHRKIKALVVVFSAFFYFAESSGCYGVGDDFDEEIYKPQRINAILPELKAEDITELFSVLTPKESLTTASPFPENLSEECFDEDDSAKKDFLLGLWYEKEKKYEVAWDFYTKAAIQGYIETYNNLGCLLEESCVSPKENNRHPYEYYKVSKPHPTGQFNLTRLWAKYKQDPNAYYELAIFYQDGFGVKRNLNNSFYLFSKLASEKDPLACTVTSIMLQYGVSGSTTERDKVTALYEDAIAILDNSDDDSLKRYEKRPGFSLLKTLPYLLLAMLKEKKNEMEKAIELYTSADAKGDLLATIMLGLMHEKGYHTKQKSQDYYGKVITKLDQPIAQNLPSPRASIVQFLQRNTPLEFMLQDEQEKKRIKHEQMLQESWQIMRNYIATIAEEENLHDYKPLLRSLRSLCEDKGEEKLKKEKREKCKKAFPGVVGRILKSLSPYEESVRKEEAHYQLGKLHYFYALCLQESTTKTPYLQKAKAYFLQTKGRFKPPSLKLEKVNQFLLKIEQEQRAPL